MAQYVDNDYKFVAVLNKKIEISYLMNALGHMTAGLISQEKDISSFKFLQYEDHDGGIHPAISHYPFIVLKAKNSNQLRTLRTQAIDENLIFNDFVDQMIGTSAEIQLLQVKQASELDLEYWGVCLFGHQETLNPITKKFSVF